MSAKFGPAGTSDSFSQMGYKNSLQVPEYLVKMGLDHFEYQCGRGVNIGEDNHEHEVACWIDVIFVGKTSMNIVVAGAWGAKPRDEIFCNLTVWIFALDNLANKRWDA